MNLLLFKYCVPSLLGYALFVGISGHLNPFFPPRRASDRATWLIGLCTGLSITLLLVLGLHMAYEMSGSGVRRLIGPSIWLYLTLTVPAAIAYFVYRSTRSHASNETTPQRMDLALETPLFKPDTHASLHFINDESLEQTFSDTHAAQVESAALTTRLEEMTARLHQEEGARMEVEKHLQILRKALYVLDQEGSEQNRERIDIHLELEESLAQKTQSEAASVELAANKERQRIEAEIELRKTKAKLIRVRKALRVNAESRAEALDTARKASQLASYSNAARRQLERHFDKRQVKLDPRQANISRLLSTLEAHRRTLRGASIVHEADVLTRSQTQSNDAETVFVSNNRPKIQQISKYARPRLP